MFKEGVRDILIKLDEDLVGLIPVKLRVRQIAALLVLDKVHLTSHRTAILRDIVAERAPSGKSCGNIRSHR